MDATYDLIHDNATAITMQALGLIFLISAYGAFHGPHFLFYYTWPLLGLGVALISASSWIQDKLDISKCCLTSPQHWRD